MCAICVCVGGGQVTQLAPLHPARTPLECAACFRSPCDPVYFGRSRAAKSARCGCFPRSWCRSWACWRWGCLGPCCWWRSSRCSSAECVLPCVRSTGSTAARRRRCGRCEGGVGASGVWGARALWCCTRLVWGRACGVPVAAGTVRACACLCVRVRACACLCVRVRTAVCVHLVRRCGRDGCVTVCAAGAACLACGQGWWRVPLFFLYFVLFPLGVVVGVVVGILAGFALGVYPGVVCFKHQSLYMGLASLRCAGWCTLPCPRRWAVGPWGHGGGWVGGWGGAVGLLCLQLWAFGQWGDGAVGMWDSRAVRVLCSATRPGGEW
jgi:hypothetical protein